MSFPDEDSAVESILNWAKKNFCSLSKHRREKKMAETESTQKGRRTFRCPHGIERKIKSEVRNKQNVKFSRCPVQININEQADGTFVVTSLMHAGTLRYKFAISYRVKIPRNFYSWKVAINRWFVVGRTDLQGWGKSFVTL